MRVGVIAARPRLALDGGEPVRDKAFPPWPVFGRAELAAAERVLLSGRVNYWTGEEGRTFEREFAKTVERRHAVAVANGTVALEAALRALGIGPGDEVVVPARTFIATASAAAILGAVPVVADVDERTQALSAETVAEAVTGRTKAVVIVHLGGWPASVDPVLRFARERGIAVVEDCAQALGATSDGRPVGSFGDVSCFSFCQDKILTTAGEGGMVVTDDDEVFERVWSLKDHGKDRRACQAARGGGVEFRWLHESFGTNLRMSEVQSAVGRAGLQRLPGWLETRRRNGRELTEGLAGIDCLRVAAPQPGEGHAYYRMYAFVKPERLSPGWDRARFAEAVGAEGVPCTSGACPDIGLEKAFGTDRRRELPVSRRLGATSLAFLVHPTCGRSEISDTIEAVAKVAAVAGR